MAGKGRKFRKIFKVNPQPEKKIPMAGVKSLKGKKHYNGRADNNNKSVN